MIRTYAYYSFGGYRIYKIDGKENELLDDSKEVTAEHYLDYMEDAALFFDRGGSKVVYRSIREKLVLTVKEIPSLNKDSDGRPVKCAVQFIGDSSDRKVMDNMAISICSAMQDFEEFFASLFFRRGGFGIQGEKLAEYIASFDRKMDFLGNSPLLGIPEIKGDLILFVPLSESFIRDSFVRKKTMSELKFTDAELKKCIVIPAGGLGGIHIAPVPDDSVDCHITSTVNEAEDDLRRKYEKCRKMNKCLLCALAVAIFAVLLMIIF